MKQDKKNQRFYFIKKMESFMVRFLNYNFPEIKVNYVVSVREKIKTSLLRGLL
jgi:hypothetical protein